MFDNVIANGKTAKGEKYGLVPLYGDLFRVANDNNKESVFAIQAAAATGTINNANPDFVLNFTYNGGPAGCCGFFQPSFELSNSFRTAAGLPLLDGSYTAPANELKTDQLVPAATAFVPDTGPIDPRLDHSVGRRGLPYLDHGLHPGVAWIRDQNYGGPYAPKKFVWTKAEEASGDVDKSSWTPGYSAINVTIIRFADVLLMAAEAEIEVGGAAGLVKALGYINLVRARAANSPVMNGAVPAANYLVSPYAAFADQAAARTAVRFERKLELGMEGHRFFDLVRWEIAATTINTEYFTKERTRRVEALGGAVFTPNKHEYLPIPEFAITASVRDGARTLKQNPGY